MTLALNLKNDHDDECGLKVIERELYGDSERMSLITTSMESSFWTLTSDEMAVIMECDAVALSEETLFNALKRWSSKKQSQSEASDHDHQSWLQRMRRFVPMLRFPMMSMQFLVDDILPIHSELFAENDDFLHIVLYKMCIQQKQCDVERVDADRFKLCCSCNPRSSSPIDLESTVNLPLDVRIVALCAENDKLRAQIEQIHSKPSSLSPSSKSDHGVVAQPRSKKKKKSKSS